MSLAESCCANAHDALATALTENAYAGAHEGEDAFDLHALFDPVLAAHRIVVGGDAGRRSSIDRSNAWLTPWEFTAEIRRAFGGRIDLDPCTEPGNPTRAVRFFTAADDGLSRRWNGNVFVNPPYSRVAPWIDKSIAESESGARVLMLLPVRTDASYHQRLLRAATDVLFVHPRIRFARADGGPSGSPAFGSMVVGLNVSCAPLDALGMRLWRTPSQGGCAWRGPCILRDPGVA